MVSEAADAFDGELGRELRQGVGADLRADAEESERLALQTARRRRTLVDVARELMARGDLVGVGVPGRRFTGVVTHAAGDLVVVRTAGGLVDVNLRAPAHLRVLERAPRGGETSTDGPSSFKARLFEIELAATPVAIGCSTVGDEQRGTIAAVGVDHVVWHDGDGAEWFLPIAAITHVLQRPAR